MKRFYFDHAACYPLLPEVKQQLTLTLSEGIWNPSSTYYEGRLNRDQIDLTREILSEVLGCLFGEIIFCSSGTESVNTALVGVALAHQSSFRKTILVSAFEHPCVLETVKTLLLLGYKVEFLPVNVNGILDLEFLKKRVNEDVLLISVMHANNEIGTIQPIKDIVLIAKAKGCLVHTDAAQTFLNLQTNWQVEDLGADLISISGHKIGALPGIGALYVRSGVQIEPLIRGGGQERDMRGGTENLLGIISLREAIKVFGKQKDSWHKKMRARSLFLKYLLDHVSINPILTIPEFTNTLSGHLHLIFPNIWADSLLIRLDHVGVCASSGSACSSGSLEPSHVLTSIGFTPEQAMQGIRFTFGFTHSDQEVEEAALRVCEVLKEMSSSRFLYKE